MINFSPNSCSGPWNLWRTECHNGSHQSSLPTPSLILPGLSPFPGGDCRSRTRLWFLYYSPLLFDEPLQLKKRLVGMSSPCYLKERKKRQIYSNMYMLWLNFILGLKFIFLCFNLIIIHYHTPEQGKMKFKPRIKLNYCTTYTLSSLEMASVFFFGLSPRFYLATSRTKWFENQRKLLPQSNGGNVAAWTRKDQGKWREIGNQSGIAGIVTH